jgi:hypothetical protein
MLKQISPNNEPSSQIPSRIYVRQSHYVNSQKLTNEAADHRPLTNYPGEGEYVSDTDDASAPQSSDVGTIAPSPPDLRDLGDPASLRKSIYDRSLSAVTGWQPLQHGSVTLQLANPRFDGPETYSLADQKKAILERKTLGRRLRGTWQLRDNATGGLLEERDETLAQIPFLTQRGTFINNGVEYALINQFRLRPGVFTRRKENDEAETHVHVQPGTGPSHRYSIDPAKGGVFFANIGQAKIPLVPLLRSLGVNDRQLHQAWGPEVAIANLQADQPAALRKYAEKFLQKADLQGDEAEWPAKLVAALGRMKLDPEVTSRTMGRPVENLNADAILGITQKLLAVSRGEADVDDRDNLAYQSVYGPDDLISERLEKDYGGLRKKLAWQAHRERNLKGAIPNYLNRQVQSALLQSGLGQALEEVNALELLEKQYRITRMGQGGIGSSDSIPEESRAVNDSLTVLRGTLDCFDRETEVYTKKGWKAFAHLKDEDELACLNEGVLEYHCTTRRRSSPYSGLVYGAKTKTINYLVTPSHLMYLRRDHTTPHWQFEPAADAYMRSCRIFSAGGFEPYVGTSCISGLKPVQVTSNNVKNWSDADFDLEDWAEFVGWYLADGNFSCRKSRTRSGHDYRVVISKHSEASAVNYKRLLKLLSRLPFTFCPSRLKVDICGKQLAVWASQFGYSNQKFIPPEAFEWPIDVRRRLMDGMLSCDGRTCVKGTRKGQKTQYCTTSKRLANDFQRLVFSLGESSRVVFEPDARKQYHGCWVVHRHMRIQRTLTKKSSWTGLPNHYMEQYSGPVYSVEVPGRLVYVRRKDCVGFWCGDGLSTLPR